ncbi:Transposase [Vibrio tubiashii]|uniref:Transposase n=1 Tax=Vibrio tubiashii ATCC 19109 TaxID=1051646 RepID=F9T3E5_9VIBR|nr:transposase [Vibrio tubiashii ATCC 19109]EGU57129.1 hypothetical protein VITU9109_00720 [Vibrio tubiashii ATCC 19109]EIF03311.1 transposase [Vibrio tubiashii NCIMB 1337 = ATCC 19106]
MVLMTQDCATKPFASNESHRSFYQEEGAATREQGHPHHLTVGCQKLYGSNQHWEKNFSELRPWRVGKKYS